MQLISSLSNFSSINTQKNDSITSVLESSELNQDNCDQNLGKFIGHHDPFIHAYTQPVLRAYPRAYPEQPFPPKQLGREEVLRGAMNIFIDEEPIDSGATV